MNAASLQTLTAMLASGSSYLTAEQGQELFTLDLIVIDSTQTSPTDPNAFLCTPTDAGRAAVATPQVAEATPLAVAPVISLRADIALPTIKRGGGGGRKAKEPVYPFTQMEIGQSFHVSCGDDLEKTSRKLSAAISNANKASCVPAVPPVVEMVTKRRAKRDAEGNVVKTEDGKRAFESYQVEEQKMVQNLFFVSRKVDTTDPDGAGIRVFRVQG